MRHEFWIISDSWFFVCLVWNWCGRLYICVCVCVQRRLACTKDHVSSLLARPVSQTHCPQVWMCDPPDTPIPCVPECILCDSDYTLYTQLDYTRRLYFFDCYLVSGSNSTPTVLLNYENIECWYVALFRLLPNVKTSAFTWLAKVAKFFGFYDDTHLWNFATFICSNEYFFTRGII